MRNGKSVIDIRKSNRSLLLERLYFGSAASRKRLSVLTGLTPASVTQLTSRLIDEGVLIETEKLPPQNRTGRAEQLLDIDRRGLRAVGVVVTESGVELNITDLSLALLRCERLPLRPSIFESGELADAVMALAGDERSKLTGIGISVRGSVDPLFGVSMDSYGLLPRAFVLSSPLHAATGLPVSVDNNVRAMLTAHSLINPATAHGVTLLIKYGPGVGGALMLGGEHFLGSRFTACEIGHICAEDGGLPCVCGKRGCLETLLRYDAICSAARERFSEAETPVLFSLCGGDAGRLTADAVYEAFSLGDKGAAAILEKPLAAFAMAVASAQAMYDPDCILLCSEVFRFEKLSRQLEAQIARRSGKEPPRLRFIANQEELAAKSAAAIAVRSFITSGAAGFSAV